MSGYDFSYARKGLPVRIAYLVIALVYRQYTRVFRFSRTQIVILCYHAVTRPQMTSFRRQMVYIADRAAAIGAIDPSGPQRNMVCVTFDDAFACLLDTAVPVTGDLEVPIAVFAVTGNLGRPPAWQMDEGRADRTEMIMTADQLRALDGLKTCQVESHTVSHPRLADMNAAEIRDELNRSRLDLQDLLGRGIDYLALPYGSYDAQVVALAQGAGYRAVLTLDEIGDPGRWPAKTMGRFLVSPDMWDIEFKLTADGGYGWLYPWRRMVRRVRRLFVRG